MRGIGRIGSFGVALVLTANSFGTMVLSAMMRPQVGLVTQSNLLIWDPATKTEHLIQSSSFVSEARKFDFLVPTPSIPRVREVGDAPLGFVTSLINPPRPPRPAPIPEPETDLGPSIGIVIREGVEVKQVVLVGNLKATTIRASDVIALSDWMAKNGYIASQSQNQWLEKYVQKRWYLTAFQVNSESDALRTSAVRLTFKTDVPVLPYTSPQNSWISGIKQEMFLVSPVPLQGTVGGKSLWGGKLVGHTFLSKASTPKFAKGLGLAEKEIPALSWTNRYLDESPVDGATDDLYFFPVPKGIKK